MERRYGAEEEIGEMELKMRGVTELMSFGKMSLVNLEHFALITCHSFYKVLNSSGQ